MYLTPHDTKPRETAVSDHSGDEAGAPEVTDEMLAAGAKALGERWLEFVGVTGFRIQDEVLSEIFLAMTEARPKSLSEDI